MPGAAKCMHPALNSWFGGARSFYDHLFVVNHKEPKIMKRIENPKPPGPQTNQVLLEQLQHLSCRLGQEWLYFGLNGNDANYITEFKEFVQNILLYQSILRHVKNCEDM